MKIHADRMEFEKAEIVRKKIEFLKIISRNRLSLHQNLEMLTFFPWSKKMIRHMSII